MLILSFGLVFIICLFGLISTDHAELLWEEFTQGIQTFFSHKASHKASLKNPKKKVTPLLIPYGRFSKVIIYYLASNNNIHRRPNSVVHHTGDDFILGNLKFVPKGESVEVFGMAIPDPLITEAIQQSSYYPKYLEMVAENTKKTPLESASLQPATKHATPKKPTTTTPVKQSKPAPPPTKKPSKRKLPQKVRKGKPTFQLVDEDDEAQQESIPQEEGDDPDLELAKKMSLEAHQEKGEGEGDDADMERAIKLSLDPAFLPQGRAPVGGVTIRDPVSETTSKLHEVVGKGKAVVTEEQVAHSLIDLSKKKRTTDQFILVRRDQTPHDSTTGPSSQPEDDTSEKVIHESSSTSDSERTESETETAAPKGDKDQGEVDSSTVTSGVSIPVSDPEKAHEALARPDPKPMKEDQTGSDSGKLHVSLAGPNPEHMDDEFLATAYPKVHENLKLITDERVIDDKPESQSGSMSSMKNLDDTFNFGDQFLYDKPTEDDQSVKNQESEKSPKEIIRAKKEQGEEKQDSTYSIRWHDSDDDEDDDDNEGPSVGSNQVKSSKRRRHDSGASGSAQPPIKDDEQSSRKPRESDPESEHSEQSSDDIPMQDEGGIDVNDTNSGGHMTTLTFPRTGTGKKIASGTKADFRSEREYDISAVYGITHWWFRRKEFYINKHSEPSDREAVRSQMRILSVISVKVFEKYGYNYLREIILRRADYQEYKISEKDFKNLHPNDFEDLFLLNIQEKLNHLPKTDKTSLHTAVNMWIRNLVIRNRVGDLQLGIESYQTKINLERPNWDAADYYFKEDYTIVPKPRAVVYRDRNDQRKLMRLNELHKFSDGTLTRVMEKLDHMVKDFHLFEYNKGMETRKWSEDDKRRSKDFITAIEKRLQIRRIYRSLESFVGGRIRDIDYRLINRTT
ncbi:hypothetical protein Tco_0714919 [Tanacetum coccineum]